MAFKDELKTVYQKRIAILSEKEKKANRQYIIMSLSRLLVFLVFGLLAYFFYPSDATVWLVLAGLASFLFTVRLSIDKKRTRDVLRLLIEINEDSIKSISGDFSSYESGESFKTAGHPYAEDLDLWGEKSVFQLLNRTSSDEGKKRLAVALQSGAKDAELNKAGVNEMQQHLEWCQEFTAEGLILKKEEPNQRKLSSLKDVLPSGNKQLFSILGFTLPFLTIGLIVSYNQDWINLTQLLLGSFIVLTPALIRLKKTNELSENILSFEGRIAVIKKQLQLYEKLEITEEKIKAHKNEMFANEAESTIIGIQKLNSIYRGFEFRNNAIVGMLLNYLLGWDFHLLIRYAEWYKKYANETKDWEEKLADIEVWISGAEFARHQKEWCFANLEKDEVRISRLRHPFVNEDVAVPNELVFADQEHFHIITGPNMAGKSTYLRSIGLAFVLSKMGFPVPAESCTIRDLKLYSSMRTADDLNEESSYFHAELSRLRFIVDAIEKGEKVFIILDEILKGTNSKDKAEGSARFLMKLKSLGAKGVIATHDLSLCELAQSDQAFKNVFFDSTIREDELSFDYKLREGICQNMNASFLLKQMGLV